MASFLITKIFILLSLVSFLLAILDKRKRVLLIGVDGLFQYCLDKAETSGIKRIQDNGSYTYRARTAIEAMSGPGWSNILCGIDTEDSGIVDNNWVPQYLTRNHSAIIPITGYTPIPCVYEEIKKNNKDLITKTSYAWDFMMYFGNSFIPGKFIDDEHYCFPYDTLETTNDCDLKSKNDTLKFIGDDFDFIFSYYGSVDETGHLTGFCSDRYIQQVNTINGHINSILDELDKQGIADSTYVILTTDHGAQRGTSWHGAQNDDNLLIPWMVKGPGIKKNYEIKDVVRNNLTPKMVLKLLGYEGNSFWRAKIPNEIFEESSFFDKENNKLIKHHLKKN